MQHYTTERDGQLDFFTKYLRLINNNLSLDDILSDNTDGVINGNLIEFKLRINDINAVLFQAIKYLSAFRVKGKSIPASIMLISLNEEIAYHFNSDDYLDKIEEVYHGGASRNVGGFSANDPEATYSYGDSQLDEQKLIDKLRETNYTKIHIDENCIVGWAERFYRENPTAKKSDFIGDNTGQVNIIGEIRAPGYFANYIHAYTGEDNVKFKYLMDRLNDTLSKKNLGAFYTPKQYCIKSSELLQQAIDRVPEGNDYIVLDRCAGTGNLEAVLSDDILSHVIVSTVEYYEYKVLLELLGDKVRYVIPPTEREDTFAAGLVRGADALSEEYINNPVIKQYIDNPECTIILYENPPYADTTSVEHQRRGVGGAAWKNSYAVRKMKESITGTAVNDLGNAFIWSGFEFYLRQPTDSYVVYSPAKYWKVQHLIDKKFINGYAYNRRWFHTTIDACIMVVLWSNEDSEIESFNLQGINIDNNGSLVDCGMLPIKRIYDKYSQKYFDKRTFMDDDNNGILCEANGLERFKQNSIRCMPVYNNNCIGYMVVYTSGFDNPDLHSYLLVSGKYDGNGFYLRKDNYLEKLPMFCASRYITYNREWTERGRIMKSADGSERYFAAVRSKELNRFLLKCLLFTCLEPQNHMRSFTGSDDRFYRNELCLDNTNGDTLALTDLRDLVVNQKETELLTQWAKIIQAAKDTEEYDSELTYGVYQIDKELNTYDFDDNGKKVYNYPRLNGHLKTLKEMVKRYYNSEIVPTLFNYEFLK